MIEYKSLKASLNKGWRYLQKTQITEEELNTLLDRYEEDTGRNVVYRETLTMWAVEVEGRPIIDEVRRCTNTRKH